MKGASESLIEMASRHVVEGDIRCGRQADLIERLRESGRETSEAESLLRIFEDCLSLSHARLLRLMEQEEHRLTSAVSPPPPLKQRLGCSR